MIFMLLRLTLKEIQNCNVLGTFAFVLEEQKNNCRERHIPHQNVDEKPMLMPALYPSLIETVTNN